MAFPQTPPARVRATNDAAIDEKAPYVLYWMTAHRRLSHNFALDRAIEHCARLKKPLVIFEPLRVGYRWASDRLHRFAIDGMAEHAGVLAALDVAYHPYVEPAPGAGKGLLAALTKQAAVVVTDDFPAFFLPRMLAAASAHARVRMEAVDSNGLLPLRATDHAYPTAFAFRSFLQGALPAHLGVLPSADPFAHARVGRATIDDAILQRWPAATAALLKGDLRALPIDHDVAPSFKRGGEVAARAQLASFLDDKLDAYAEERSEPSADKSSGLSPWLHWGHMSPHEVFAAVAGREDWTPARSATPRKGSRAGYWGMSASAEAFLDELITWREVGFNFCVHNPTTYDRYEALPPWARASLEKHESDPRPHLYGLKEFEAGRTHDELWNAAQHQLVREGIIHNYMRMLWGKKILEWSASPRTALEVLIELNNKYALDGRDPCSYAGIFWTLGRYDRAWGPERDIYGVIRTMSSQNTARKLDVRGYLARYKS